MARSTGLSAASGKAITDWEHVQQSISVILSTPIGSRLMRRDFGSDLPDLIDRKMTRKAILQVYSAAAQAIERWEPRFRMTSGRVTNAAASGVLSLEIFGTYFPLGHRGDYSIAENQSTRIVFNAR
jgi:phage baseplate assembly protein W